MLDINVTNMCKNVMNFFDKTVIELDKTVQFVKRESKLGAQLFVSSLIHGCMSDQTMTLETMCKFIKKQGVQITKQGLQQRFNSAALLLIKKIFLESLKVFKTENTNVFDLLKPFTTVGILDSSGISLPSHLKEFYKSSGGAASEAGIKIQLILDYTAGQIKQAEILEGRRSDQGYTGYIDQIEPGSLHLHDLGYFKISSFMEINKKSAYFISRFFNATKIFDENGEEIKLIEMLHEYRAIAEKLILLGQKEKMPVKLIAYRLSDEDAEKRARKIRQDNKKQGKTPSQEALELAKWSVYITNIPSDMLSTEHVHLVYTLRWQVELFFKLCKSAAGIAKLNGRKINRILCEIYAKLMSVVMLLYFCFPLRWQKSYELSFTKAYKQLSQEASNFFRGLGSLYRLKDFMKTFFSDLGDFAYKDKHRKKGRLTHQLLIDAVNQEVFV